MIGGLDDSELEATGVLEVKMELAVLGLVRWPGARSGVDLESIETEGDDLVSWLVNHILDLSRKHEALTFRSGERSVVTVPWGQPFPEAEALTMVISSSEGVSSPPMIPIGLAAARAGTRRAR